MTHLPNPLHTHNHRHGRHDDDDKTPLCGPEPPESPSKTPVNQQPLEIASEQSLHEGSPTSTTVVSGLEAKD